MEYGQVPTPHTVSRKDRASSARAGFTDITAFQFSLLGPELMVSAAAFRSPPHQLTDVLAISSATPQLPRRAGVEGMDLDSTAIADGGLGA